MSRFARCHLGGYTCLARTSSVSRLAALDSLATLGSAGRDASGKAEVPSAGRIVQKHPIRGTPKPTSGNGVWISLRSRRCSADRRRSSVLHNQACEIALQLIWLLHILTGMLCVLIQFGENIGTVLLRRLPAKHRILVMMRQTR